MKNKCNKSSISHPYSLFLRDIPAKIYGWSMELLSHLFLTICHPYIPFHFVEMIFIPCSPGDKQQPKIYSYIDGALTHAAHIPHKFCSVW